MPRAPHELSPPFSTTGFQEDLYAHYRRFHRETPVFRTPEGVVYLTRHADCSYLLGDAQFRRNAPGGGCPFGPRKADPLPLETMIEQWVVFMDPPRHGVVRKAFSVPFSPKNIARIEPFIRRRCAELVGRLPRTGPVEMLRAFAFTLPIMVIAELVGIPEEDMEQFYVWSSHLAGALDRADIVGFAEGTEVTRAVEGYFRELLGRAHTLPEHCLIRLLAEDPELTLTPGELVSGLVFMLLAGHETTKNLLACGVQTLAGRPDLLASLKSEPTLIPSAVEEMLRYDSPVQKICRWTQGPSLFGDYEVGPGTLVTALIGAANRDPAEFEEPEAFNPLRQRNRHIAFGTGPHFCLGSTLARLEGRAAFEALLPMVREMAPKEHAWRAHSSLRSLDHLVVDVTWA